VKVTYRRIPGANRRAPLTRAKLALMDGKPFSRCAYCNRRLSAKQATVDHVKPKSAGGYDKRKNYALACRSCNHAKGSLTVAEFLKRRAT
jgi:5-methylcytosine-specific restriction endonuclease McrA